MFPSRIRVGYIYLDNILLPRIHWGNQGTEEEDALQDNLLNKELLLSAKHVFVSNNTVFGERQAPLLRGNNGCPLKIPSLTRHNA